eukprot:CAMPEP_0182428068 /NCGR_PEP_ID=MMETSP1167-20130531/20994_1 /TAXON_ID=2988 /ORGANISM="Mallomonas Sp, Strain CCMP3275" /LENGTH=241 /DNA_ID=CAMNT_0024610719 /DNA_START=222 /DNA_END=947 /DNA_ORIENTATION=+
MSVESNIENEDEIEVSSDITEGGVSASKETETEEEVEVDPKIEAIKQYTNQLRNEVKQLETFVRSERLLSAKTKDKLSESGKAGYFIVQAQVNDFLRKTEESQKERVKANKREFVLKILPIVDAFRAAPLIAPATTDEEQKLHDGFTSLLTGVTNVIKKYGYTEFAPEIGDKLNPKRHEVEEVVEDNEVEDGAILEVLRPGVVSADGSVLRRAVVKAAKTPAGVVEKNMEKSGIIDGAEED